MDQNRFWSLLAKQLSGEASEEEKSALEELIKTNPDLSYAAQHITDLWMVKPKGDPQLAELAFQKHLQLVGNENSLPKTDSFSRNEEPGQSSFSFRRSKLRLILSSMLLLTVFAGLWFVLQGNDRTNAKALSQHAEISTRHGSRSKLVLPDSSVVWLNAGSKLTYDRDFGNGNRNTTLVGEAFFEVKKGTVPFLIKANGMQVKVLGTAFNVKSYPNELAETSLIRGKVEIILDGRPGEKFTLKPNEKLVVAAVQSQEMQGSKRQPIVALKELTHLDDNIIFETSWVENKLIFHDESLEEMARKMERWYNVSIDIQDKQLAQKHVGGGPFENENIEQALTALQIAFNFNFTMKGNKITITH